MRNLQFENEFDVVINMFTSFGLYEDEQENLKVLQEVSSALRSSGCFLIDMINKPFRFKTDRRKDWWYIEAENVVGLVEYDFDALNDRAIQKFAIFDKNGYREHVGTYRLYTFTELKNLLKLAGFDKCTVYGDFKKQQYSANSPRMIVIARKPNDG